MIDFSRFNNLLDLTTYFCDEQVCIDTIVESRWGKGDEQDIVCPYCGQHHCVSRTDGRFRCKACRRNFSCRVGTIFEDSKLPLFKWFVAMYLISSHKKGVSSCQLGADINISQKSAWYMEQKIKTLYKQDDEMDMSGTIECDEVYIGGKEKWKHESMKTPNTQGRSTKTKTPVFGMLERGTIENKDGDEEYMSIVKAVVVKDTKGETLRPIIEKNVLAESTIYTDELSAYNGLSAMGYDHKICNHSGLQFVCDGEVYTNNIEGFWSHFRRMITGVYHNVSDEHLQTYIDEAAFRWNTRKMGESERFAHMFQMSIGLVKTWDEFKLCA